MKSIIKSITYAINGIRYTAREERNFRIHIVVLILVLALASYLGVTQGELIALIIVSVLVLASEMMNTAFEDVCNKISLSYDYDLGKIKDISAGFVLVTAIGALIVGIIIFAPYI